MGFLTEEVNQLFEGIEVTDELKENFSTKLESLISNKHNQLKEELEEANKTILEAETEVLQEEHEEKIDQYLTYAVQEYMKENKLEAVNALKVEAAEKLIEGMKDILGSYNLTLNEDQNKIVDNANTKVERLKEEVDRRINSEIALAKQVEELEKELVLSNVTKELTESQKEKLESFISDIEYNNKEAYTKKVSTIIESFIRNGKSTEKPRSKINESRTNKKSTYRDLIVNDLLK